jgi:DNA-binding Lrp family transcriptional regulator
MTLDTRDRRILALLEEDARIPLSAIARKLKTSQQVVSYRLAELQRQGVISEYYTIINFSDFGYSSYRVMLQLKTASDQERDRLIDHLLKLSNILWLVECGGKWDLLLNIMARHPIEFNRILDRIKRAFPALIQGADVLLTTEGVYYGRNYLAGDRRLPARRSYFGSELRHGSLDDLDKRLLAALSRDARASAVSLATACDVSAKTLIARMKELEKHGVIAGHKPLLHLEKMGYAGHKALVKTVTLSSDEEKRLFDRFLLFPQVVGVLKFIGEWDIEIEFETAGSDEMLRLSREFRAILGETAKEFQILPLYREYKYDFFPQTLIER